MLFVDSHRLNFMKLVCNIKNGEIIIIQLKRGKHILDELHLTVSRNLDNMLITAIDKLAAKNRIDRLSLKTLEIQGKMRSGAVSSMILKTVKSALGV